MSTEIVKAISAGDTALAAEVTAREIMNRISSMLDEKKEFMTKNLFKSGLIESDTFVAPNGSAQILGPSKMGEGKSKGRGAPKGLYKKVEDKHDIEAIENHKDDTQPIPDSEKKGRGLSEGEADPINKKSDGDSGYMAYFKNKRKMVAVYAKDIESARELLMKHYKTKSKWDFSDFIRAEDENGKTIVHKQSDIPSLW